MYGLNRESIWKICIDRRNWEGGRLVFDKDRQAFRGEPGYIDAMESAVIFISQTIGIKLTPQYIPLLYTLCASGVSKSELDRTIPQDYETSIITANNYLKNLRGGRLPLHISCCTEAGLEELKSWYQRYNIDAFAYLAGTDPLEILHLSDTSPSKFLEAVARSGGGGTMDNMIVPGKLIEKFIQEYYVEIEKAETEEDKLIAIAAFVKKIDTLHPFEDGNMRTCVLLYTKLLIENNMNPACMFDPNVLDGHSTAEIAKLLKEGMEAFNREFSYENRQLNGNLTEDSGGESKRLKPR